MSVSRNMDRIADVRKCLAELDGENQTFFRKGSNSAERWLKQNHASG